MDANVIKQLLKKESMLIIQDHCMESMQWLNIWLHILRHSTTRLQSWNQNLLNRGKIAWVGSLHTMKYMAAKVGSISSGNAAFF